MYPFPLVGQLSTLATSGVVNTDVTHTLLAAPGAGFFIRVLLLSLSFFPNNTGNIEIRFSTAGGFIHNLNVGPTGPSAQLIIPMPGFALNGNTALQTISRSNVVTQNFRVVTYTITDTV